MGEAKRIINFDLFKHIVYISGCREAQDILKDFLLRFDPSAIKDIDAFCMLENMLCEKLFMPIWKAIPTTEKFTLKLVNLVKESIKTMYPLYE